mmetsp:Transcript_15693/g.27842  ORF Transcript_15693/g.27842 Transcript_15693/m.27842 type:complete len:219 (+) Transcript_15693:458-1114(+)
MSTSRPTKVMCLGPFGSSSFRPAASRTSRSLAPLQVAVLMAPPCHGRPRTGGSPSRWAATISVRRFPLHCSVIVTLCFGSALMSSSVNVRSSRSPSSSSSYAASWIAGTGRWWRLKCRWVGVTSYSWSTATGVSALKGVSVRMIKLGSRSGSLAYTSVVPVSSTSSSGRLPIRYSSRSSRVSAVLCTAYIPQYGAMLLPAASKILLPPGCMDTNSVTS